MKNFLFVAAENDGIPQCKAGGLADVVRDVPRQIAARGDKVHVVVPSYSRLHQNGEFKCHLHFMLRGIPYKAALFEVRPKMAFTNITHYVIHHPEIKEGTIAHIYHHDKEEPFFTDVVNFFIFCTAVAQAIKQEVFGNLDIVHLHDWHTSTLLFLREYHFEYSFLQSIKFIYSIHNLAIQGIRPFGNNYSSIENWFPQIAFDYQKIGDKRYNDCVNLMKVGIRLADVVHTVSPSYKEDVLYASNPPIFIGGESLEEDLQLVNAEGRLFGILNGVNYGEIGKVRKGDIFPNILNALLQWIQDSSKKYKSDFLAHTAKKIAPFLTNKPSFILSSVARLTEQKFYFFKHSQDNLIAILNQLKAINGIYLVLGTGAPEYEEMFQDLSHGHDSLIFVNGQSEDVIDSIYLESDLYFMPSLFEPCGISQMLAMRNGVPCLVHKTGGLKDTVEHGVTGFVFGGDTYNEKVLNMVMAFEEAFTIFKRDPAGWKEIQKNAKERRFSWDVSVEQYYRFLYNI